VPKIKKIIPNAKIILTGCLSQRKDVIKRLNKHIDLWLNISELPDLADLVHGKIKSFCSPAEKHISAHKKKIRSYLSINPKYGSRITAYVPIGNGCNNFCTYCVVPYARGREIYRDASEIISEVSGLVSDGYKEIILIAQNVNCYRSKSAKNSRRKSELDFAGLLELINKIPGDFWISFITSHPKDMSKSLVKTIAQCEKVCKYIHLPVQAGENEILKKMKRNYTISQYKKLISSIRKKIPEANISTDLIVGFPGETAKQFKSSKILFSELEFDMAYISQYSPRPGTAAAKMDDNVLRKEKAARERSIALILEKTSLKQNKKYINRIMKVLIIEKNRKGVFYGRTFTRKSVEICEKLGDMITAGNFYDVKIKKVRNFGLVGEIINPGK
jgi:tRNA-2-methylthio-N6-dimethylallyladenosine synthase